MLIQANKISKNFGGTPLFEQLTFHFYFIFETASYVAQDLKLSVTILN